MKANYQHILDEQREQASRSEVALGNLYDMNKQMMLQEPEVSEETILFKQAELVNWIADNANQQYFMMLCNERRDYTIFRLKESKPSIGAVETLAADVIDCLRNRGTIHGIDLQEAGGWELWIKDNDECFAYYSQIYIIIFIF